MITDRPRPASLVNFSYSDTESVLLGCRRRFGVNMGFSDKDRIFMKNLYIFKGCGAKELIAEFPIKVGDCGEWD